MRPFLAVLALSICPPVALAAEPQDPQQPARPPGAEGELAATGAYVIGRGQSTRWKKPAFVNDAKAATGRKTAKVVVVVYDPVLPSQGGKRLTEHLRANDPRHYSHILVDVIRQASWGYLNYEIVDVLTIDGFPQKVDGFRYTEASYLAAREKNEWQPAPSSYAQILRENGLIERSKKEGITEVWLWGASGMHFDEFAGFVKDRYTRFGPTDNEWLYRPYDIPGDELGRTFWVMGFNYEVGPDNMIHSYTHRVESQCALAFGDGIWDPKTRRDPWNVFTRLEMDFPGEPSMVGNCHVPPNGTSGYDYGNARVVPSFSDCWHRYPDLRGEPRPVSREDWGGTQFGYQKWILERLPKSPGHTEHGYANWWVYIANVDGDLPEWTPPEQGRFQLPAGVKPPAPK
jgi:hypothetical protein